MLLHVFSILITLAFPSFALFSSSPFIPACSQQTSDWSLENPFGLQRRQSGCPSGYDSCSSLGDSSFCCKSGSACALDQAGHVACCPSGSACTGTVGVDAASSTDSGFIAGSSTVGSSVLSATTTNAFIIAGTGRPSSTPSSTTNIGGSTVQNAQFPFAYIPTTYPNAAACSSYYTSCQQEYASCTASLGGGINGVTVSGAGVGITVQGASAAPSGSAISVCSSLSSQACYGLQVSACQAFGTSGGASGSATGVVLTAKAAATRCVGGIYGIGVGMALGVAGQVMV